MYRNAHWNVADQNPVSKPHANHFKRDTCRKVNICAIFVDRLLGIFTDAQSPGTHARSLPQSSFDRRILGFSSGKIIFNFFFFPIAIVRFTEKFPAPLRAYDQRPRSNRSAAAAYECFGRHLDPLTKSR